MYGCVGLASRNPPCHVPRSKCDGASESGRAGALGREREEPRERRLKEGGKERNLPRRLRSSETERDNSKREARLKTAEYRAGAPRKYSA